MWSAWARARPTRCSWTHRPPILRLNIRVDQDVERARPRPLNRLIPGADHPGRAGQRVVVLTGEAANASAANSAVRLAAAFVSKPEQVVNMLSVTESEQVQLKVRVVEVNRTVIKQLGVNLNALVGQVGDRRSSPSPTPRPGASTARCSAA